WDLTRLITKHKVDVIHSFESTVPRAVEVYTAGCLGGRPVLISHMGNWLPPFYFPRIGPVTMAVPHLLNEAIEKGWPEGLLVLWSARIRTDETCSAEDVNQFLQEHGVDPKTFKLVSVNRLEPVMNERYLEFLIRACEKLWRSEDVSNIRLILVGDGPSRQALERVALEVQARVGWGKVVFTGEMPDPIPAYMAADVVIGRSSSLLRAMALGKPCIMVGENFSRLVSPENIDELERLHYYNNVQEDPLAGEKLCQQILKLVRSPELRAELGRFARQVVVERHSIELGAKQIEGLYSTMLTKYPPVFVQLYEIVKACYSVMSYRVQRWVLRRVANGYRR
ncbi:MAG TPA: glycosyltransferase, partial [Desulfobacterales bacterium]|nr:glycosyltransferase [Desulfobacterales bacterium]